MDPIATIEEVTPQSKTTHEQRLASFIRRQQKTHTQKKNTQGLRSNIQKEQSKRASVAVDTLINLLEGFGAEVTIEHKKAPKLSIPSGETGYGEREIMINLWFTEDGEIPHFGKIPDDDSSYISAQEASGYSVAQVSLSINPVETKNFTVFGKSICSANEYFNGNIGAFLSIMDALFILSRIKKVDHPLKNLFLFAVSLFDLELDLPAHYRENLSLAAKKE